MVGWVGHVGGWNGEWGTGAWTMTQLSQIRTGRRALGRDDAPVKMIAGKFARGRVTNRFVVDQSISHRATNFFPGLFPLSSSIHPILCGWRRLPVYPFIQLPIVRRNCRDEGGVGGSAYPKVKVKGRDLFGSSHSLRIRSCIFMLRCFTKADFKLRQSATRSALSPDAK